MLISRNNRLYDILMCIKQDIPYHVVDKDMFSDIHKYSTDNMLIFSRDGINYRALKDDKVLWTLADINPKITADFIIDVIKDKTHKNRVFCNATFSTFFKQQSGNIKREWLIDTKSEKGILFVHGNYTIYSIENTQDELKVTLFIIENSKDMTTVNAHLVVKIIKSTNELIIIQDKYENKETSEFLKENLAEVIYGYLRMMFFIQFAEVETKIVNRKSGKIKVNNEKFINTTDFDVEVIDANYYNTIIRTEGFGVRGHWRYQPYGINRAERKLTYIKAFQKNGYTREAKILKLQD